MQLGQECLSRARFRPIMWVDCQIEWQLCKLTLVASLDSLAGIEMDGLDR